MERKARFIAQITSPLDAADTVRTVEDLDSDVVLSYAEIKAVATGNPLIREHAETAGEVARLSRLATNHARTQRSLPHRIAGLDDRAASLTATIDRLAGFESARSDTRGDRFAFTTVDGTVLRDRRHAGERFRDDTTSMSPGRDRWRPVGRLGGLEWAMQRRHGYPTVMTAVRIVGDSSDVDWTGSELWDSAAHTLMVKLERHLDKVPDRLAAARQDLTVTTEQAARARRSLGQPFPHHDRLGELTARLAVLDGELAAMDQPDPPAPPSRPTPDVAGPGIGL